MDASHAEELSYEFFYDCYKDKIVNNRKTKWNDAHEALLQMILECSVCDFKIETLLVDLMFQDVSHRRDINPESCKEFFRLSELYSFNLLRQPWKNEIKTIKKHTGVFVNNLAGCYNFFSSYLDYIGYTEDRLFDTYKLTKTVDRNKLIRTAFDCFIAAAKCALLESIYHELEQEGYSWLQVTFTATMSAIKTKTKSDFIVWIRENVTPENVMTMKQKRASQHEVDHISDLELYGHNNIEPVREQKRSFENDVEQFATVDEHLHRSIKSLTMDSKKIKTSFEEGYFDNKMRRPSNDSSLYDSSRYDIDRLYPESEQESDMSLLVDIKRPPVVDQEKYSKLLLKENSLKPKAVVNTNYDSFWSNNSASKQNKKDKNLMSKYEQGLAERKVSRDLNLSNEKLKSSSLTEINEERKYSVSSRFNSRTGRRNVYSDSIADEDLESDKPSFSRSQSHDISLSTLEVQSDASKSKTSSSSHDTGDWKCDSCTIVNDFNMKSCKVCAKSRVKGAETTSLTVGGKTCLSCTYINDKNREMCKVCKSKLEKYITYV